MLSYIARSDIACLVWAEAITSRSTQSFFGLDSTHLLPVLRTYISNHCLDLALLSELHLCSVRASIIRKWESLHTIEASQWLFQEYRRYAIWVLDLSQSLKEYRIPLIELTVDSKSDSLEFAARACEDAARILPRSGRSRFVLFPQTRFSFVEDEVLPGCRS